MSFGAMYARSLAATMWVAFASLGFYRGFHSVPTDTHGKDPPASDSLCTRRARLGLLNAALYSVPPFALIHLSHLADRAEISVKGEDPRAHPDAFCEFTCTYPRRHAFRFP